MTSTNEINTGGRHDGERSSKEKEMSGNHKFPMFVSLLYIFLAILTINIQWPQPKLELDSYVSYMRNDRMNGSIDGNNLSVPLSGTNIVITGATSGIGLGLTNRLFDLGAHVIAIGRSSSKLQSLEKELNSRRPKGMTSVVADFGNLNDVALASNFITNKFKQIDFLINNAGIHHATIPNDAKTEQGYEATFGSKYIVRETQ